MKHLFFISITFLFFLFTQNINSQTPFATIKKNVNSRASSLSHNLNSTKDTLVLKSPEKISYIYSINREYKREIDTYIGANEYKVPLRTLSKGKHVFAVSHLRMKIVFVIWINEDPSLVLLKEKKLITSNKDKD